jgi:hypothetical protein
MIGVGDVPVFIEVVFRMGLGAIRNKGNGRTAR